MAAVTGVVVMLAKLATDDNACKGTSAGTNLPYPGETTKVTSGLSAVAADTTVAFSWTASGQGAFPISGYEVVVPCGTCASSWVMMADDLAADGHVLHGQRN